MADTEPRDMLESAADGADAGLIVAVDHESGEALLPAREFAELLQENERLQREIRLLREKFDQVRRVAAE
jgi:hypothetical protein